MKNISPLLTLALLSLIFTGCIGGETGKSDLVTDCQACDPRASCTIVGDGAQCVCPSGYEGDGTFCEAVGDCADLNCDPNARCVGENPELSCECLAGYDGDGISCTDVDECQSGSNTCSAHATCTNTPGSYECECQSGFEGNGMECTGTAQYGETCMVSAECESQFCIGAPDYICSVACDPNLANGCHAIGSPGLCVPIADGTVYACYGDLETGLDSDDTFLVAGDTATRSLNALDDADLFRIDVLAGEYRIEASPVDTTAAGVNLRLEIYSFNGDQIGTFDMNTEGQSEVAILTQPATGWVFAVVRNVGSSTGQYSISVQSN
jgi:hypothetical protein